MTTAMAIFRNQAEVLESGIGNRGGRAVRFLLTAINLKKFT